MSVLWAFLAEPPCKFEIALPTYFMALHITMKRNRMLTEDHLYHDTYGCKWTVNLTVVLGMGPLVPWLFLSSLGWSNAEQLLQVVGAPSTCFVLFCFDLAPCSHIRHCRLISLMGISGFTFLLALNTASSVRKRLFWFIDLDTHVVILWTKWS